MNFSTQFQHNFNTIAGGCYLVNVLNLCSHDTILLYLYIYYIKKILQIINVIYVKKK